MAKENADTQAAGQPQAEAKASPVAEPKPTDAATPATPPAKDGAPTAASTSAAVDPNQPKKKKSAGVCPPRGKKLKKVVAANAKKAKDAGVLPLKAAVALLKTLKRSKFDETIEIHINTGIDPTQGDQMVRGAVPLPNGIGKSVRVAVFCQADKQAIAKAAGADVVGAADLVEKVQKEGFMDFDVAITTQDMMPQVARLGKVLGPRGLMPTPKAGTVIPANADIAAAVKEFKAGKVEYRSDKTAQIHAGVGKMSFDEPKLIENINVFVEAVRAAKPNGVKGNFIQGIVLSATMCPGIRVSM
ncbi:50S ribosomal protein L1 [Limnoglobus roseus]|uniref:Large ribosomal subunit protein uL1 n=1 Tax=Limnoglobus roseus TaxID=2598579 RepID=A0A5C1ABH6_9BACT|nr:50S ribosomal protein L1 [Limnoglobus roseus]QEL15162.1 50S ribosomal protein L1 [Limnoglobus roseus]